MSDSNKPKPFTKADVISGVAPFTEEEWDKLLDAQEAAEVFKHGYYDEMHCRSRTALKGLDHVRGLDFDKTPWMTIVTTPHREENHMAAWLANLDAQRNSMFDAFAMPFPTKTALVLHQGEIPEDADPAVTNIRMQDIYDLTGEEFAEKYGVNISMRNRQPKPTLYEHQRRTLERFSQGHMRHLDVGVMPIPRMTDLFKPGRAPITNYLEQAMHSDDMMTGFARVLDGWVHSSVTGKVRIPIPGDLMFVDYKTTGGQFDQIPVTLKPKYNKNSRLNAEQIIRGYSGGKSQTFAALHQYELHKQDKEWGQWNRMVARQEALRIAPLPRATLNVGTIGHCEGQPPHYLRKKLPALIHKLVQAL